MQYNLFAQINTLHKALEALSSNGAPLSGLAKRLLSTPETDWTPGEKRLCWELLSPHREKLKSYGILFHKIPEPPATNHASPIAIVAQKTIASTNADKLPARLIIVHHGKFKIIFKDNEEITRAIMDIPGKAYHTAEQSWYLPINQAVIPGIRVLIDRFDFAMNADAAETVKFFSKGVSLPDTEVFQQKSKARGAVKLSNGKLDISFVYDRHLMDAMQRIEGAKRDKFTGNWKISVSKLDEIIDNFPAFEYDEALKKYIPGARAPRKNYYIPDLEKPLLDGKRLRKHQKEAIPTMVNMDFCILAHDMGLGKTLSALMAASIISEGNIPIIVVCPASLRLNWELEAFAVGVRIKTYSWAKLPEPFEEPFILIADEAHYACGLESKRTQDFLALAYSSNLVSGYFLTGTPMPNGKPINLFPLLKAARHPIAKTRSYYEKRYCAGPTQASNLIELHARITRKMEKDPLALPLLLRKTKKECLDLPDKQRIIKKAEISYQDQHFYEIKLRKLQNAFDERVAAGLVSAESEALVALGHLRMATSLAKVEHATWMAKELLQQGEQVVLFTDFRETANLIAGNLEAGLISGDVNDRDLENTKRAFQRGDIKSLVCTFKRGGVGHTLTAASNVILVDRPWRPGDAEQAEDRLHRDGQKNQVITYWLQADLEGGLDEAIDNLLLEKSNRIELVMKGQRKTLRGTQDINELKKEIALAIFRR